MLSVFGDESSDEKQARVFAVAGVVGYEVDWQDTEREWRDRTGGEPFHASECERKEGGKELYKDLTQIIANSRLGARGMAIDLAALRDFFPGVPRDLGYYKCFMDVIIWLVDNAAKRFNEPIEFTFHHGRESQYNAGKLYDTLVNTPEWEDGGLFMQTKISFEGGKNPRIQMADLIARETMKSLDHQILGKSKRISTTVLCDKNVSIGLFDRNACANWRSEVDRVNIGPQYGTWLKKNKLAMDNMSNRIRYIEWFQAEKIKSGR